MGDYIWGRPMVVVQTDGRDRTLLCLAPRDPTVSSGVFAAARIMAGKTRDLIGWDLEDGDNGLVCRIMAPFRQPLNYAMSHAHG